MVTEKIVAGLAMAGLAAAIQILNAIGALTLVFAFRYGKAIIVAPLVNAGAPLLTSVLSMILLGVVRGAMKIAGIVLLAGDGTRFEVSVMGGLARAPPGARPFPQASHQGSEGSANSSWRRRPSRSDVRRMPTGSKLLIAWAWMLG